MVLKLILIGAAVALDPLPLMAFLVVLPSKRGVRKGAAFVFGWLASLAIVVAITVLATGNNPPKPNTAPSCSGVIYRVGDTSSGCARRPRTASMREPAAAWNNEYGRRPHQPRGSRASRRVAPSAHRGRPSPGPASSRSCGAG